MLKPKPSPFPFVGMGLVCTLSCAFIIACLCERQIKHTIPERRDQRPTRPLHFDEGVYTRRNVVECCINWLRLWHGLATRHEKRALNYRAMLVLAAIVLWLDWRFVWQAPSREDVPRAEERFLVARHGALGRYRRC